MRKIKTLFEIYYEFAKIGLFTIGGGMAMMPMMKAELIEKKKWMTDEELIDYFAIGQSTPGIIAINVSTFIGYKQWGIIGGIVGTLGMVTPSLVIIILLAGLINSIDDYPIVQKALKGINVSVAALLTSVTYNFAKKTVKNWTSAILLCVSFILIFFLKLPSWAIVTGTLILGICVSVYQSKKHKEEIVSELDDTEKKGGKN